MDPWLLGLRRRGLRLKAGYWGSHVGFYGGINYGFGYGGAGYQGGRWDNGRFYYNSAVNNIGAAHIANVYRQPIVNNTTTNRASFNGGNGGVMAKPTNEELLAEKEATVKATPAQVHNARVAAVKPEQFVTTNKGKPAVAATAKSGEFTGKGALPAKAAGKAAEVTPAAEPETKEKPPAIEKPAGAPPLVKPAPPLPPGAPKAVENPPATEVKPAPTPATPRVEEKPPAVEKPVVQAGPRADRAEGRAKASGHREPVRPVVAPNVPKLPPVVRPAQPERRPAAPAVRECGRPGLPPCPK